MKYLLEIICATALALSGVFLIFVAPASGPEAFSGSDTAGSAVAAEIAGTGPETFQPLIPQWVPPSREAEAGLFAIQAAAGGIMVGGVFGYWIGQRKKE